MFSNNYMKRCWLSTKSAGNFRVVTSIAYEKVDTAGHKWKPVQTSASAVARCPNLCSDTTKRLRSDWFPCPVSGHGAPSLNGNQYTVVQCNLTHISLSSELIRFPFLLSVDYWRNTTLQPLKNSIDQTRRSTKTKKITVSTDWIKIRNYILNLWK